MTCSLASLCRRSSANRADSRQTTGRGRPARACCENYPQSAREREWHHPGLLIDRSTALQPQKDQCAAPQGRTPSPLGVTVKPLADARSRDGGDDAGHLRRPLRRPSGCYGDSIERRHAAGCSAVGSAGSLRPTVVTSESRLLKFRRGTSRSECSISASRDVELSPANGPVGVLRVSRMRQEPGKNRIMQDSAKKNSWSKTERDCAPGGTRTPNPFLRTELLFH